MTPQESNEIYSSFKKENWNNLEHQMEKNSQLFYQIIPKNEIHPNYFSLAQLMILNPKTPESLWSRLIEKAQNSHFENFDWMFHLLDQPERFKKVVEHYPATLFLKNKKQQSFLYFALDKSFSDEFLSWMCNYPLSFWDKDTQNKTAFIEWLSQVALSYENAFLKKGTSEEEAFQHKADQELQNLDRWMEFISIHPTCWQSQPYSDKDNIQQSLIMESEIKMKNNLYNKAQNYHQEEEETRDFDIAISSNPLFIQLIPFVEHPVLLQWAVKKGMNPMISSANGNTLFHTIANKLAETFQHQGLILKINTPETNAEESNKKLISSKLLSSFLNASSFKSNMKSNPSLVELEKIEEQRLFKKEIKAMEIKPEYLNATYEDRREALIHSWSFLASLVENPMQVNLWGSSPIESLNVGSNLKSQVEKALLTATLPQAAHTHKINHRL